ncbi:MAG: MazG nucleotide pyrophosphohydrolase domain-containing protein [Patescibacteria group bacterium]
MEIKKVQKKVHKIFFDDLKSHKIKAGDDYLILKITEELGEFVQSYLIHKKRCRQEKCLSIQKSKQSIARELADVLCLVLVIAKELEIDLDEAVFKKWISKEWVKYK